MFILSIKTDSAAFSPDPRAEVARILSEMARAITEGSWDGGSVADLNGVVTGRWSLSSD